MKPGLIAILVISMGCSQPMRHAVPLVPAVEYAKYAKMQHIPERAQESGRAALRLVKDWPGQGARPDDFIFNETGHPPEARLYPYGPDRLNPRDYNGPLSLGDPGVSSSLWRDSSSTPNFYRDQRAWQPFDLITVLISESTEGKKEADTEIKSQTSVMAGIANLFGLPDDLENSHTGLETTTLITAETQNDFKGEGETTRKGELRGTISCMVMEVLPSGILRVEGTKIIALNNEEQVMVLSGLIRQRDITSSNQIDSSRIANLRIDYYGTGIVGNAQSEGWLGTLLRRVWPF